MNWEEFFKIVAGSLATFAVGVLAYHATTIMTQLKELGQTMHGLQMALQDSTTQTRSLVEQVSRLDGENASLRRAHDALTRYLIGKGILSAPDPVNL